MQTFLCFVEINLGKLCRSNVPNLVVCRFFFLCLCSYACQTEQTKQNHVLNLFHKFMNFNVINITFEFQLLYKISPSIV